ncbi:DUF3558 family protein, partial [Nocardia xishanensis]
MLDSAIEGEGMARRIAGVVLVAAIAGVVAACGGTTEGAPSTATSAAEVPLFNPCIGIPDDVLRSAGVDPATEESGIAGVDQHGWEICRWSSKEFFMTVFSTSRTVGEFEKKPGNIEFQDVTVAGREGRQFKVEGASKEVASGRVVYQRLRSDRVSVSQPGSGRSPRDPS